MSNRKQYVSIDECNSDFFNVLCGVPQGSILGPKLFILYVNDICNISKILKFVLFADDTNIFCSAHDAIQFNSIIYSHNTVQLYSMRVSVTKYNVDPSIHQ